ncbi:hypothetical protein FB567DRAFT_606197 [Paraphoma chrysanthemicola]|uniref:Peptidase C1A papain C-terminal domain-containing protein n=1 Tax=Paraphoma chrysanthemicola TaxID=798071 RepID=A0A8K0VW94_9PLEO|nr:hypothetical protein FB567DRAFT_606197 [Paraphoma chrysanthemicola]
MTSEAFSPPRGGKIDEVDIRDRTINIESLQTIEESTGQNPTSFCLWDDEFKNDTMHNKTMKYEKHLYDQGRLESCTCNAVASAYRYLMQRRFSTERDPHGYYPSVYKPSRLFLYWVARIHMAKQIENPHRWGNYYAGLSTSPPTDVGLLRDESEGTAIRTVIMIMARLGAPRESDDLINWESGFYPYTYTRYLGSVDAEAYAKLKGPELEQVKSWSVPHDSKFILPEGALAAMRPSDDVFKNCWRYEDLYYARPGRDYSHWKRCIANGLPIVFSAESYPGFDDEVHKDTSHLPKTPQPGSKPGKDDILNSHTMIAIGWNDTMSDKNGGHGCFKVQNSWGITDQPDPNYDGCCWIPYAWLNTVSPWRTEKGYFMINSPWALTDQDGHTTIPNVEQPWR